MFLALLVVTFLTATAVATIVARLFEHSITTILQLIFAAGAAAAWRRYVMFAMYVAGISGGAQVWTLARYLDQHAVPTRDLWVLEIYGTLLQTLQSMAWLLFVFFAVAVLLYAIVRRTKAEVAS